MINGPPTLSIKPRIRSRLCNRLRFLGILRERELVQVYRIAQENRIAPEAAIVALGILTQDQILAFLTSAPSSDVAREGLCSF
jgi:hypothetical protein